MCVCGHLYREIHTLFIHSLTLVSWVRLAPSRLYASSRAVMSTSSLNESFAFDPLALLLYFMVDCGCSCCCRLCKSFLLSHAKRALRHLSLSPVVDIQRKVCTSYYKNHVNVVRLCPFSSCNHFRHSLPEIIVWTVDEQKRNTHHKTQRVINEGQIHRQ